MKVCPNCFADKELSGFILSSSETGNCNVCESNNQPLLNITELLDFFQELVNNFKVSSKGEPLRSKIQANWNFFSSDGIADKILNIVLPLISTDITTSTVLTDYTNDIIENYNHWETLKEELKWKNRFVIDLDRLAKGEFGWDGFFNTQYRLSNDVELYRARLHHQSGLPVYNIDDMNCPPKEIANGGRANPSGIPFLYLSDNTETVLYEIRASFLDELSIGTFRLKNEIKPVEIVDFTEDTSLFQPEYVKETIKGKLLREKISSDLSKPMRRYDSELEYIPTQFICEFIKVFTGADGIRFRSSLHPEGNNIVMFNLDLMECRSVKLMKISSIKLKAVELK